MRNVQFDALRLRASICPMAETWPQDSYEVSLLSEKPTVKGVLHWSVLLSAVETARQGVAKTFDKFTAIDDDKTLSPTGKAAKKREIATVAIVELEKTTSLSQAREAVEQQLARWNSQLGITPKAPANVGDATQLAEIRAHIAAMKKNRMGFIMQHADDPRVVQAVLGGPAFLSGLTDTEFEVAKAQIAKRVAPEIFTAKDETLKAMAQTESGWKAAIRQISERGGLNRSHDGMAPVVPSPSPVPIEQKSGKKPEKKSMKAGVGFSQRAMPTWQS